jgi:hypothetical protein
MDDLKALFQSVTPEEGTRITSVEYGYVGQFPIRQERWSWDGIKGQTVVFRSEDVNGLSDRVLEALLRSELDVQGQITIKRSERFAFVNHSFKS